MTKSKMKAVTFIFLAGTFLALPVAGFGFQKTAVDKMQYENDRQFPKPRMTLEEIQMNRRLRQGAFARQLIYSLELEKSLPLTASEEDCIKLLTSLGITPLKGWSRYAPLTEDDYTVVIGKAIGKEFIVHEKAQEICDKMVKLINVEWQLYKAKNGKYPILEKLMMDKRVFPTEPACPYGWKYEIVGYQPHIARHNHIIRSPLKSYLFRERDLFKKADMPGVEK